MFKAIKTTLSNFINHRAIAKAKADELTRVEGRRVLRNELRSNLINISNGFQHWLKNLNDALPDLDRTIELTCITGELKYHNGLSCHGKGYDIDRYITDDVKLDEFITHIIGIAPYHHDDNCIAVLCSVDNFLVGSMCIKIGIKTLLKCNGEVITESTTDAVTRYHKFYILQQKLKGVINFDIQQNRTSDVNGQHLVSTCITETYSLHQFLNFPQQELMYGAIKICNAYVLCDKTEIRFDFKSGDDVDEIISAVKSINEYIDMMFANEQKFLKDNLQSIIIVNYTSGHKTVIHTSNADDVICNDHILEYTDLFTGLRNTILLAGNVLGVSQDNMQPKFATLLPAPHVDLFNQGSIRQIKQ